MSINYFDFFSGIGGFKVAMDSLDISTKHIGFCEIDKNAINFYNAHHKKDDASSLQFVDDVEKIKVEHNKSGIKLKPFNFLLAGFPCQSFSNVGYRRGIEDERGRLFYNILHLLEFYKPQYFILENVQKLSTINKGGLLLEMIAALEECGYHVHVWDLIATDYGVPQKRKRIFFAGIRSNNIKKIDLPPPPKIPLTDAKYPTVWHLLERDVEVDERHYIPTKTRKTVLYKNPKWCGDVNIDNPIGRPITASMAKWHRANQDNYFSEKYINSKTPWVRPKVDLESEKVRRITPLEGYRMQGFDDEFEATRLRLNLSYAATYKLIGNSVPVPMARSVIKYFLESYKYS
jgi:DNA (cytosine-5)-methyltransferase 1